MPPKKFRFQNPTVLDPAFQPIPLDGFVEALGITNEICWRGGADELTDRSPDTARTGSEEVTTPPKKGR